MKMFKNILVVRTDRIGDVIVTTPLLKQLRQDYPLAKITFLVSALTVDLIEDNPFVDEILVDDRKGINKGLLGFGKFVLTLAKKHYDLAIILHTKKRTNAFCYLAGIPVRVGYKNNKLGYLLTHPIVDVRVEGKKHESLYCLDVLQHIPGNKKSLESPQEVEGGQDLYVAQDVESDAWADVVFAQEGFAQGDCVIAIHAGASDKEKRCSADFFAELIESLIFKYNAKIIIIGARLVKSVSQEILSGMDEDLRARILDLVGVTTLSQLVSILKKSSLLISNDSGPVHIAAALKKPVLSLFVRNEPGINAERWHPLGERSRYLSVPKKVEKEIRFSQNSTANSTGTKNPEWQAFITKERVLEEVDSLFKL